MNSDVASHDPSFRGACRGRCLKSTLSVAALTQFFLHTTASAESGLASVRGTNIFAPLSPPAESIYTLSMFVLAITGAIFLIVGGLLTYAVVRYRRRPGDDDSEPPQVYGSGSIELAWTVLPLLIVFVLFLITARTIGEVQGAAKPSDALDVTVIGHQWWWEIAYPQFDITTANELHVPVSDPEDRRPVWLRLESADVVHSFWVPRLAGKTDLVPNRANEMWFEAYETGTYLGQCAEYCGTQHAHMLLRVVVHTKEGFDAWVKEQQRPAIESAAEREGRDLFFSTACINCHTVGDGVADGRFGPDLTHLMSRETIGAGAAANTVENLRAWINDPDQFKPGVLMPAMDLDGKDLDKLVAYLATLE